MKKLVLRRWLGYLIVLVATPFVLFAAVRGSIQLANRQLQSRYPPPGQMVPVGPYRLHLFCAGQGRPTVIIEPGMGTDWVSWWSISQNLASTTRVCVYDRAGYGWSEAGPKPRTAGQSATELHDLLTNAGIAGPYILVAHSFGAYISRIFASRFRDSVRGVVLVDPSYEEEAIGPDTQATRLDVSSLLSFVPPLGWQRLRRLWLGDQALPPELRKLPLAYRNRVLVASSIEQLRAERNEFDSLALTEAQMRAAPFPQQLPLTVLTAERHTTPSHLELQAKLAKISGLGKQVLATGSGHSIHVDQPELIVNAVRALFP